MLLQVELEGIFSLLLTLSMWGIVSIIHTLSCVVLSRGQTEQILFSLTCGTISIWCFIGFPEVLVFAAGNIQSGSRTRVEAHSPLWVWPSLIQTVVTHTVKAAYYQILRPLTQILWLMLCLTRGQLWVSLNRDSLQTGVTFSNGVQSCSWKRMTI